MSKPDPTRYRTTNWSDYNAALRKRGSRLIWVDKDMTWLAPREGRPARPPVFLNAAIQFCLSIARQGIAQQCPERDQGAVQAAAPANDRDGGQLA
jgi:hypothetical protein